jgi:hypothetical protein
MLFCRKLALSPELKFWAKSYSLLKWTEIYLASSTEDFGYQVSSFNQKRLMQQAQYLRL